MVATHHSSSHAAFAPGFMSAWRGRRGQSGPARAAIDTILGAFAGQHIDPAALQGLAAAGLLRDFDGETEFLRRGAKADAAWLLHDGQVSVGSHDARGQWWQTRLVTPGQWIDATSAWLGGAYLEGAIAHGPVQVVEFPVAGLDAIGHQHGQLYRLLLSCACESVRGMVNARRALLTQDVTARLALWLLETMPQDGSPEFVLPQHKRTLASQLGATPETFSRAMRQLREAGLIESDHYCIRIADVAGLRRLVDPA